MRVILFGYNTEMFHLLLGMYLEKDIIVADDSLEVYPRWHDAVAQADAENLDVVDVVNGITSSPVARQLADMRISRVLRAYGVRCHLPNLIAPTAIIQGKVPDWSSIYIGHGAYVGPRAEVHYGCCLMPRATLHHDSSLELLSIVSGGAQVMGRCKISLMTMIGPGAMVFKDSQVGDHVIIGAGVAVQNVPPNTAVVLDQRVRRISQWQKSRLFTSQGRIVAAEDQGECGTTSNEPDGGPRPCGACPA